MSLTPNIFRQTVAFVDKLIQLRDGNLEFSNTFRPNMSQLDLDLLSFDVSVVHV